MVLIVLVVRWDGWLRGAHCFSFVMGWWLRGAHCFSFVIGWLDPWCSLF